MFDTALVASNGRREAKRKLATLPAALAAHAAALGVVMVGQLWAVDGVVAPSVVEAYVEVELPTPPPGPRPGPPEGGGTGSGEKAAVTSNPGPITDVPNKPPTAGPPDLPGGGPGDDSGGRDGGIPGGASNGAAPPPLPPPPPEPPKVYTLELVSAPPAALSQRAPVYPEAARRMGVTGTVVLRAVIDERGDVVDVRVVRGLPMGCGDAAADAVRSWRYRPATLNDRPVSVELDVRVTFRLAAAA